ncbi:MAG: hypothetical protein ACYDAB_05110 [bacterium]
MLGLSALQAATAAPPPATPRDALTLVRQALAALEVSPPDVAVATERVIKALFARDTRGVDMPRVRDAAQALGAEDATAASAYLMKALRPAETAPGGVDQALLIPVRPRFAVTPAAYGLLAAAVLLLGAGSLIARE